MSINPNQLYILMHGCKNLLYKDKEEVVMELKDFTEQEQKQIEKRVWVQLRFPDKEAAKKVARSRTARMD